MQFNCGLTIKLISMHAINNFLHACNGLSLDFYREMPWVLRQSQLKQSKCHSLVAAELLQNEINFVKYSQKGYQ